jgi:hypothetical protein
MEQVPPSRTGVSDGFNTFYHPAPPPDPADIVRLYLEARGWSLLVCAKGGALVWRDPAGRYHHRRPEVAQ